MITAVCSRLNALGPTVVASPLTGGLVLGIDQDPTAKVTQILFDASGEPRVVAKVSRRPHAEAALRKEHRVLEDLRRLPLLGVDAAIPTPLLLERVGGRLVLATTALPGGPMSVGYYRPGHAQDPELVARDFALAGGWLARFQHETWRGQMVIGPDTFTDTVRPLFERYRVAVGWSRWEEDMLDGLARCCEVLSGVSLPLVAVHGDYALGNVLVTDDVVSGVVDWELGRDLGLPLTDVFKFAASYGGFLDRAVPPRQGSMSGHPGWAEAQRRWGGSDVWPNRVGFLHAYLGTGWFADLVRGFLRDNFRRLGAPAEAMTLLLPLFVAEQAMALENPVYRAGYRSVLEVLAQDLDTRGVRGLEAAR